jgi:outer membrane biosynthesis protein TonB
MERNMASKPHITCLVKILIAFPIFFLYEPSVDFAFSATAEGVYIIHVSSFTLEKNAEIENSKLRQHGLETFYRLESVKGKGNWFRLYIGPFRTRSDAREKAANLSKKGIISYAMIKKVDQVFFSDVTSPESEEITQTKPPAIEKKPRYTEVPREPVEKPIDRPLETSQKPVEKPTVRPSEKPTQKVEIPKKERRPDEEKRVERETPTVPRPKESRFSLSLGVGVSRATNADNFIITEPTASGTDFFSFSGDTAQASLEANLRVYKPINLYGCFDYGYSSDVSLRFLSLGLKWRYNISGSIFPYFKGGGVYGDFTFDDAPGEFEENFGWEAGIGIDLLRSRFKIGLDFLYRDIQFDYNNLGIPGVTSTTSSIDATGFSLSGTISYYF